MKQRWWRDYELECAEWLKGFEDRSPEGTIECITEGGLLLRLVLWTTRPGWNGVVKL